MKSKARDAAAPETPAGQVADDEDRRKVEARMARIKHKIVVLSGKGGVGKSMVAVNLAAAAASGGLRVGLLDVDIHGPSLPVLLGLEGKTVRGSEDGLVPVECAGLKVMSIGFLLQSRDDAVIWRGPMKMNVIRQFLQDVAWGDLDVLVIDSPPGTGDEPLSVCQLIEGLDGAVIVTTPQRVAAADVRKSISFCGRLGVPVLGVVENMSGFACPHCGTVTQIWPSGPGRAMAEDMKVPFLGSIPLDPEIARLGDAGQAHQGRHAAAVLGAVLQRLASAVPAAGKTEDRDRPVRIVIPLAGGKLASHFGHCERFALVDADAASRAITRREDIEAPPHEPGLLPAWLAERGATVIIAGGMGSRAQGLFTQQGIKVFIGAPVETPERLAADFLSGTLPSGENICDH